MNRRHGQTHLDDFVTDVMDSDPGSAKPIVVECHRRLGKTFWLIKKFVELCLKKPRSTCIIGAPTLKQVKDIVMPDLDDLLVDCPPEFKPYPKEGLWLFNNPAWKDKSLHSRLKIVGCDYKKGNLLRGTGAVAIGLDEAGYIEHLDYIVKNVIAAQFDQVKDPLFVLISTPPRNMDHDFTRPGGYVENAIKQKRHMLIPGSRNKDFTEREKSKILDIIGGDEKSVEYLREVECKHISDDSILVVPEYQKVKHIIEEKRERPKHFVPWMCMDTGWTDYTAVLFGYVDFDANLFVYEDMIWTHYRTLGDLADMIRKKEHELYDGLQVFGDPMIESVRRLADCTEIEIQTLYHDFELFFEAVDKYDKNTALGSFRTAIQRARVRIDPERCAPLVYQLENATWNERRGDFERSKTLGHCDALVAAVYLNRMVLMDENPFPDVIFNKDRQFSIEKPEITEANALMNILGRFQNN